MPFLTLVLLTFALLAALAAARWWARRRPSITPVANADAVRLEELLQASPLPGCITEAGRVCFANRPMTDLSGATPGDRLGDMFMPGRDRDRAVAAGRGEPCDSDTPLQLRRSDGSVRYVTLTTVPAYGRGAGVYLQWMFDRTEHRRAEQAAAHAEARHRTIVQSLADSIIVIDERGRIQSFSPSAEKTFGYRADEVVGQNVSILMPPPDRERHDGYLREYVEGGWASGARERLVLTGNTQIVRPERETVAVRKDGSRFPARLLVSEVDTGSERFFVGLLSDLTERKNLEREVADRAAFQEALLQSIPYPMFVVDAAGRFLSGNTPHAKAFGMTSVALRGKTIRDLPYVSEEMREQLHSDTRAIIQEGGHYSHELSVTDPAGASHVAIFSADAFRTSAGEPGGLIGLLVDITDQKRIAAELKAAKERAEQANAIIEAQKRRMQDELDVGRRIQMSMVPTRFPVLTAADLWGTLRPAREVGGDFYDCFTPTAEELWLCIGDVSGKGVPAALLMAVTKTLIKSFAAQVRAPGDVLTRVNEELSRDNENAMFVTAFIARLELPSGRLHYSNAGHNPPLLRRADRTLERLATRHGVALGAAERISYGESATTLLPGDALLLYTDGVSEALNISQAFFTEEHLREVVARAANGSARELANAVMAAVDLFANGAEQADDITLLSLRYGPPPMSIAPNRHTLQVRNDLAEVPAALERVTGLVAACGGDARVQNQFALAFDELLGNIVKYGYPADGPHVIECEIGREGDAILAVIRDDGVPFNPLNEAVPDISVPLEARAAGGLGIHLVRRLFDDVQYQRHDGCNVLTLVKHDRGRSSGSR